ncbi:MAG: hypothetical protein J7M19_02430 [Planctomycetes bacterium]|nr:hypothetical protein [Planctomycetota bacterium]
MHWGKGGAKLHSIVAVLILAVGIWIAFSFHTGPGRTPAHPEQPSTAEAAPDAAARAEPLTIDLYCNRPEAAPGDTVRVAARITIDPGWHINSNKPLDDYAPATEITLKETGTAHLEKVTYPAGGRVASAAGNETLSVYEGTLWVEAVVRVDKGAPSGETTHDFQVRWQACSGEQCLIPQTALLSVPLAVDPDAESRQKHQSLFDSLDADRSKRQ